MAAREGTRGVELVGDSPELIAFVILKSIIQVSQNEQEVFDKDWLLDTYSECLAAVKGQHVPKSGTGA